MCKSQADGGQRCATHTGAVYATKKGEYLARHDVGHVSQGDELSELLAAATMYATTRKGIIALEAEVASLRQDPSAEQVDIVILEGAIREGRKQREITKEVERQIALARRNNEANRVEEVTNVETSESPETSETQESDEAESAERPVVVRSDPRAYTSLEDFFAKVEWEGGVSGALDYGLDAEEDLTEEVKAANPEFVRLWQEARSEEKGSLSALRKFIDANIPDEIRYS